MTGEENAHWLPACVHGTERHAQLRQCWEGHSVLWCAARERMERSSALIPRAACMRAFVSHVPASSNESDE
eukprot:3493372-Rhodomonas_salina.1